MFAQDNQYEVLTSSKYYDVGNPIVDFYAYNCKRKDCSLESEEVSELSQVAKPSAIPHSVV